MVKTLKQPAGYSSSWNKFHDKIPGQNPRHFLESSRTSVYLRLLGVIAVPGDIHRIGVFWSYFEV